MRCHKCGRELPEDAEFCLKCGAPVKKAEPDTAQVPAGRFLKLSWTWQPMVMATTNDDELGQRIYELWKQKARFLQLLDIKEKDGLTYVWYYPEKLRDIIRASRYKQDILSMYDSAKELALTNGWKPGGPEETAMAGRNDYMSLDSTFVK